ncbi:helix-turn-helix domain-containing protein [Chryseobacterium sp.]|uniref:AraC family transcriptional regulator n=1 Tax=Chryseobacterium sp. TaxID=1871047 RepID=UPI0025B85A8A|nr:helix-turn-helix domain-containing protein [Chryseobacterium sp.]MBV8325165.1 AraC family transcriptional regulator [Chryseobacterium sp.]
MSYQKISPPFYLKPYIHHFLIIENKDDSSTIFRVMADGYPGLIFQQGEGCFKDEKGNPFPKLFVHGLGTRFSQKTGEGKYLSIIVCLQPDALKTILGVDAYLLTNHHYTLDEVVRNSLCQKLQEARTITEKLELLSVFIWRQIIRNKIPDQSEIRYMLNTLNTHNGLISLREIRDGLRISERSLERLVKSYFGVSPQLFMRIQRFQRALHFLESHPDRSFTDICYEYSYADQSHYIREFREFAGSTPKQFLLKSRGPVTSFSEWD